MGRLRVLSGREACRILEQHGFREVRRRGSHIIMQYQEGDSTRTVPVPDHRELRVGTLLSVIRQSGVSRELFEE
ncbi:MAG: type II toxin-antitoxin system HicA family toxin [Chloroflexi bacterium]|nr:type II toxin-antitoxin system HicA family toxin [Chloroflexota bacterium]MDA1218413.1 type II toxin-antitoxin system HicA family toxin [Chloroflexota bacterium]